MHVQVYAADLQEMLFLLVENFDVSGQIRLDLA